MSFRYVVEDVFLAQFVWFLVVAAWLLKN